MANVPISNLTTTWNNVATTFTGIKLNVTDTASAAGSLLMDLQVGGTSQFKVSKSGGLTASSLVAGSLTDVNSRMFITSAFGNMRIVGNSTSNIEWTSSSSAFGTTDLILARDAAATLAQRNGVNAQTFRLYNTFTDASNYERGKFEWASNALRIGTEKAGTGSARTLEFQVDGTTHFSIGIFGPFLPSTGLLQWSGRSGFTSPADGVISMRNAADNGGSSLQFREQTAPAAPATDNVRIYAEDNGAGKTRLMALFSTGIAIPIATEL